MIVMIIMLIILMINRDTEFYIPIVFTDDLFRDYYSRFILKIYGFICISLRPYFKWMNMNILLKKNYPVPIWSQLVIIAIQSYSTVASQQILSYTPKGKKYFHDLLQWSYNFVVEWTINYNKCQASCLLRQYL